LRTDPTSPRFSEFIKERRRRWWVEKENHPFKMVAGKQEGRNFAAAHGVKVPELHTKLDHIRDLPELDQLPNSFVLKPIRGYSTINVFCVKNMENLMTGEKLSRQQIIDKVGRENNTPFIVEELLEDENGKLGVPRDFKFYCFGDQIAFIHIIERNSFTDNARNRHWLLAENWQKLPVQIQRSQVGEDVPPSKPSCYKDLIRDVRKLGLELPMFMRIDMYATKRGSVFGEFTPQPHGGNGYTEEADIWLGGLWADFKGAR